MPLATVLDADREVAQALLGLMPLMGRLAHGVSRERGTLTLERSTTDDFMARLPRRSGGNLRLHWRLNCDVGT